MPTFTIKDPDTGRTIHMTGDKPPAESDIKAAFAQEPQQPQQQVSNPMNDVASGASGVMRGLGLGAVPNAISSLMNMPQEAGALMGNQQAKQQFTQGVENNPFTDPRMSQALQSGDKNQVGQAASQVMGDSAQGFNNAMMAVPEAGGVVNAIKSLPLLTKTGAAKAATNAAAKATEQGITGKWEDIAQQIRNSVQSKFGNSIEHRKAINKLLAQEAPAKLGKNITKTPSDLLTLRRQILARTGTKSPLQKLLQGTSAEDQVSGVARDIISQNVHKLAPNTKSADTAYRIWSKIGGSPVTLARKAALAATIDQTFGKNFPPEIRDALDIAIGLKF